MLVLSLWSSLAASSRSRLSLIALLFFPAPDRSAIIPLEPDLPDAVAQNSLSQSRPRGPEPNFHSAASPERFRSAEARLQSLLRTREYPWTVIGYRDTVLEMG